MTGRSDPWTGQKMLSFKVSDELATMLQAVATHEHRTVSSLIRRACMEHLSEAGYFDPGQSLDTDGKVVKDLLKGAKDGNR